MKKAKYAKNYFHNEGYGLAYRLLTLYLNNRLEDMQYTLQPGEVDEILGLEPVQKIVRDKLSKIRKRASATVDNPEAYGQRLCFDLDWTTGVNQDSLIDTDAFNKNIKYSLGGFAITVGSTVLVEHNINGAEKWANIWYRVYIYDYYDYHDYDTEEDSSIVTQGFRELEEFGNARSFHVYGDNSHAHTQQDHLWQGPI